MPDKIQTGKDINSKDFAYTLHALADALLDEDGGAYTSNVESKTTAPADGPAGCELTVEYHVTDSDRDLLDPLEFK